MSQQIDDLLGTVKTSNIRLSLALNSEPIPSNRNILQRVDAKLQKSNRLSNWVYDADTRYNDHHWHSLRTVGRSGLTTSDITISPTGIASTRVTNALSRVSSTDPTLSYASLFEIAPTPTAENVLKLLLPNVGETTAKSSSTTLVSTSSTPAIPANGSVLTTRSSKGLLLSVSQVTATQTTTNNFLSTNAETKVASVQIQQSMMSRIISFSAKGMRPNTRVYPIFDGVDVSNYCLSINSAGERSAWGSTLITSADGTISGEFNIPNTPAVHFKVGTRTFVLTDNPQDENTATTTSKADYFSAGAEVYQRQLITQTRFSTTDTKVSTYTVRNYYDPLAQSFLIDCGDNSEAGMYITSIDVYFRTVDTSGVPVMLEIRNMVNGYPGTDVISNSVVTDAVTSADSTLRTKFVFNKPVFLSNLTEYCFVLKSDSMQYNAYISRLGEFLLNSTQTMAKQPYLGSMFVSQNDLTWTADQLADIKFVINRAKFTKGASAKLMLAPLWPNRRVAYDTMIETYAGTSRIRVFANDHGLREGMFTTITVDVPAGTAQVPLVGSFTGWNSNRTAGYEYLLNGIGESNLSGFKEVTYADAYSFELELNPDGILTNNILATEDGFVELASCAFEPNIKYESVRFVGVNNEVTGTSLTTELKGISYSSIHGNQPELVGDTTFIEIPNMVEVKFPTPRVVTSHATSFKSPALKGSISTRIATTLRTDSEFVAPMFDLQASRLITRSNLLDDPTDIDGAHPTTDWESEAIPGGGIVSARYNVRPISLANPASSIRVMLAGVIAEGNAIDVYYRTVPVGESKDIHDYPWFKLDMTSTPTVYSSTPNQFFDLTYEVRNTEDTPVPEFKTFSVKILLRGTNSCIPPVVKDLRIIALAT